MKLRACWTYCVLLLLSFAAQLHSMEDVVHYLHGRIPVKNKRYKTFQEALQLCEIRKLSTLVETGTSRGGQANFIGDGGATIIFSDWALDHGATFYSVDIDEKAIVNASLSVDVSSEHIYLVHQDSVEFLKNFSGTIDFLYLDSYDFEIGNPVPSQVHHLKEIIYAYPKLSDRSVVMIDDCELPHGGKGKLVILFLLERGWKILRNEYQVILVRS